MNLIAIIDESLDRCVRDRANCLPTPVPECMATGEVDDDWTYWVPIKSTVTTTELQTLEQALGVCLSPQYRSLLQHKHFLELYVGAVGFFAHPSSGWQQIIRAEVYEGWPHSLLLDRGYLPFAEYSDWGLWCFSLREASRDGEYPVHLWDHDRPDEFTFVAGTLEEALQSEFSRERT